MLTRNSSRPRGSVVTVALVALVPLLGAIGAVAVDLMHNNDAIGALQRSTDAGALAGAQDLSTYKGAPLKSTATVADSSSPGSNEDAVNVALSVAKLNIADGHSVYTDVVPNAKVTATLSPTPSPSQCTVDATLPINSLLAKLFGNFGQTITAHSVAGLGPPVDKMGGFMPVLPSYSEKDPSGKVLSAATAGSTYTVEIKTNALWIYNPNVTDIEALNGIINPLSNSLNEPAIAIGDIIKSDNGIKSAGTLFPQLVGKTVFFPITSDSVGTGTPSHPVIGFIAMKITSANGKNPNPSVTGIIVPLVGPGTNTGRGQNNIFSSSPFFKQGATVNTARLVQ